MRMLSRVALLAILLLSFAAHADNSDAVFANQASVTSAVSAATPSGVTVNDISVGEGSATITGSAGSEQLLSSFLRNLAKSGQFSGAMLNEYKSTGEFTISVQK